MRVAAGEYHDLSRLEMDRPLFADARPELVIHLAAQSLVRRSFAEPRETFQTNVMGTVNLLDAVRLHGDGVRAVVNVTSDKCYDNREWEWGYREHEPMGGHDPYSSSKGCAELVTDAFRRSYFSARSSGGGYHGARLASARAAGSRPRAFALACSTSVPKVGFLEVSIKTGQLQPFTGALYTPSADFTLGGGGSTTTDFIGAAIVKTVGMNGHYNFHYDEALSKYGPNKGYVVTSWNEMSPGEVRAA